MQTESFLTGKSEFRLGKVKLCSKETQKHGKRSKTATFAHCIIMNIYYILYIA